MMNMFTIVGRIVTLENEKITVVVNRDFKNEQGIYETDFINIILTGDKVIRTTNEYCKQGDIVAIKGRIQSNNELIGSQVSFLSTRKEEMK